MKIVGTRKNKTQNLDEVDILLTIDELDHLIEFLEFTKKDFIERQKDSSVKKVIKNGDDYEAEDITSYFEIVKMKNTVIDYHSHFIDWSERDLPIDIVIHTTFEAEEKDDDKFSWINNLLE